MARKSVKTKVPVSERALVARINRALNGKGERLRRCRATSQSYHNLGDYFVLDLSHNCVIDTYVDIEAVGRELGVLKGYEELMDGE